jgi:hypothetical protein
MDFHLLTIVIVSLQAEVVSNSEAHAQDVESFYAGLVSGSFQLEDLDVPSVSMPSYQVLPSFLS